MFEKIKEWCKENNTPICELEKMCGLSKGTISRWKKSFPRMSSLGTVSKVTGIKPSEFFQADKERIAAYEERIAANKERIAANKE